MFEYSHGGEGRDGKRRIQAQDYWSAGKSNRCELRVTGCALFFQLATRNAQLATVAYNLLYWIEIPILQHSNPFLFTVVAAL